MVFFTVLEILDSAQEGFDLVINLFFRGSKFFFFFLDFFKSFFK